MQPVDARAVHAEHPLDLVVHPLLEHHPHHKAVLREGAHLCRGEGRAVRQGNALGKALPHLFGQRGVQRDGVGLGDMALGGQDVVGKAAVVRQQHKAGAGLVQPPGREQLPPGVGIPDQVHHGGVPLVGGRAHHPLGLVEHEVDELLVRQRLAVHGHGVAVFELGVAFFADGSIDRHPPLLQQGFCLAPGALGRFGQIFIETHGFAPKIIFVPFYHVSCFSATEKRPPPCGNGLSILILRRSNSRAAPQHRG